MASSSMATYYVDNFVSWCVAYAEGDELTIQRAVSGWLDAWADQIDNYPMFVQAFVLILARTHYAGDAGWAIEREDGFPSLLLHWDHNPAIGEDPGSYHFLRPDEFGAIQAYVAQMRSPAAPDFVQ